MILDLQEFHRAVDVIRADIKATNDRLDVLNGRTRENEIAIGVLRDRSNNMQIGRWLDRVVGALMAGGLVWWRH